MKYLWRNSVMHFISKDAQNTNVVLEVHTI